MIKGLLRTNAVWRLTGLTYATAVMATQGHYISKDDLRRVGEEEMKPLFPYFTAQSRVIEFGCGIGINLFGIADKIKTGYGMDINAFYIRIASSLKKRYHMTNVEFLSYDGVHFPKLPKSDVIFEKGVFERIPQNQVKKYVCELKNNYLSETGTMIMYFLTDRARGSEFTKRLGDEAYVFWDRFQINQLLKECGLKWISTISADFADFSICKPV